MADNHVALDAKFRGRGLDEIGLGVGGPRSACRAWAHAEAGSVEGKHPVFGSGFVEDAACREVFRRSAVAVQEQQRWPMASLQEMQPCPTKMDEVPDPASAQCPFRTPIVVQGQANRCRHKQQKQVLPALCSHDWKSRNRCGSRRHLQRWRRPQSGRPFLRQVGFSLDLVPHAPLEFLIISSGRWLLPLKLVVHSLARTFYGIFFWRIPIHSCSAAGPLAAWS